MINIENNNTTFRIATLATVGDTFTSTNVTFGSTDKTKHIHIIILNTHRPVILILLLSILPSSNTGAMLFVPRTMLQDKCCDAPDRHATSALIKSIRLPGIFFKINVFWGGHGGAKCDISVWKCVLFL